MEHNDWFYFSKKKYILYTIKINSLSLIIPSIIIYLAKKFDLIMVIVIIIFMIWINIIIYHAELKYKIDSNVKVIPLHKNARISLPEDSDHKNFYYKQITRGIENSLIQHKQKYNKIIENKVGSRPYDIRLQLIQRNISIRIIHHKHRIDLCVKSQTKDDAIYFNQILKEIIDEAIDEIGNPFYKE